jgi:hypothetical protein
MIEKICAGQNFPLLGHTDSLSETDQFNAGGMFIFKMGWMSFFKFYRSADKGSPSYIFFKTYGPILWSVILLFGLYFLLDLKIKNFVFWMEVLDAISLGTMWMVKGEAMAEIKFYSKK